MQNSLLIGAFVILGILTLSINNAILFTSRAVTESEIHVTGIGLGQALMEEILTCAFDENTTGMKRVSSPLQLTSASNLGPEAGETIFDDVDDYNKFSRQINSPRIEGYELKVKVGYANPNQPSEFISYRTFLKKIEVTIKNQKFMHNPDSLKLTTIVSYF